MPRALLLYRFRGALIESDEAIVGLMASHILKGEFPVFYWGQAYMGTLETYLVALLFLAVGTSVLTLKLSPFLVFCTFLWFHHRLAGNLADSLTARLATMLLSVSPAFLVIWSLKARGAYMVCLLLGTVALLLSLQLADRWSRKKLLFLSFLLGAAWWSHFLSLVYLVPVCILLLIKRERAFLKSIPLFGVGFLMGSLPLWIYNLAHNWTSFSVGLSRTTDFTSDILDILRVALPILLGAAGDWSTRPFFPGADLVVVALFLLAVLATARQTTKEPGGWSNPRLLLPIVFILTVPTAVSAAGLAWFLDEPRYLLPLYSLLYVSLLKLTDRRTLKMALFSSLLLLNLAGTFLTRHEEFVGYTNIEPNRELIEFLRTRRIIAAYAPYWIAYRLVFETGEEIIASPDRNSGLRYEPFLEFVEGQDSPAYLDLIDPETGREKEGWKVPEGYARHQIGGYVVYWEESP